MLANSCLGQGYIGDKRKTVKKSLEKYMHDTNVSATIQETDSTLILPLTDLKYKPVDFVFLFDKDGKCVEEIRTGCDTCIAKYVKQALDNSSYEWIQISENSFVSNKKHRLLMEVLSTEKESRLSIKKIITRAEYDLLAAKKKH